MSPVVSLILGPFAVLMLAGMAAPIVSRGPGDVVGVFVVVAVLGLAVQLAGLVMGAMALRKVEGPECLGGRSWAITGMVGSAVAVILIVEMTWLVVRALG
jgi:hypothetical protein